VKLVWGGTRRNGCRIFEESPHGRNPAERSRKRLDKVKTYGYLRQINWDSRVCAEVPIGAFHYHKSSLRNYYHLDFLGVFSVFKNTSCKESECELSVCVRCTALTLARF
jgi:hypothetical protein